jgi:hypothetical protein
MIAEGTADRLGGFAFPPALTAERPLHFADAPRDETRRQQPRIGTTPWAPALPRADLMLSLHAEPESLVFVQAGRLPRALEQVEPEIPPKGALDHVADPASSPGRLDPDGAQNALVHGNGRPHSQHHRIKASRIADAASARRKVCEPPWRHLWIVWTTALNP